MTIRHYGTAHHTRRRQAGIVTVKLVETECGPAARNGPPALNRHILVSHRHNGTIASLARVWAVQEALRTH